jgi:hypothetical protein
VVYHIWVDQGAIPRQADDGFCLVSARRLVISIEYIVGGATKTGISARNTHVGYGLIWRVCCCGDDHFADHAGAPGAVDHMREHGFVLDFRQHLAR